MPPRRDQRHCARALLPLLAWLCGIAAALSLRYGYYGSNHLALGPNSSRMMTTSSLFVEQLQVKDEAGQGLLLYGFNDRPQLSSETNWTISSDLFVDTYSRQGFSMWLNRGSRIWMAWQVGYGGESYADMLVVLIKGEQNLEELERYSHDDMGNSRDGSNREFTVAEDGMYYLGVINLSLRSITMNMNIKIASKMYDTSKATSICSTSNGECKLKLLFPNAQYYVLATSDSEVPLKVWHIQLSFVARLTSYFLVTGFLVVIVSVILKHLGACCVEQTRRDQGVEAAAAAEAETEPIAPRKEMACGYGATEEEAESSVCCTAEDLYDGKICVICYDERRSCFFTPCGHSVACCSCAQRVIEEQNKVCPICRRLIHKWRRLPGL
ncbi:unnamed protein product [Musa acuminata subsp. burmannicoides]